VFEPVGRGVNKGPAPSSESFHGWTIASNVSSITLSAGTYVVSAKVNGTGLGITCRLTIEPGGVLDQTRFESRSAITSTLSLQSTVVTSGGSLSFSCASLSGDAVHLENAQLHARPTGRERF
jgi:hypothetical protein